MIDLNIIHNWDLKFTNQKLEIADYLKDDAITELEIIINDYPKNKHRMILIIGDIVIGNVIFNEIIEALLLEKKIKNKCLRLSLFNPDIKSYKFPSGIDLDIVMIDNIEFELLYNEQKIFLIENIDRYLEISNLIILNVTSINSLEKAPEILQSMMKHSLNIGIKNDNI